MKKLAWWIVGLLGLQFVLGMLANLYQEVPADNPFNTLTRWGYIAVHAANAMVLLVLAIVYLWQSVKARQQVALAVCGLSGIVVASITGILFVKTQNNPWSLLMAFVFIGSFAVYLVVTTRISHD